MVPMTGNKSLTFGVPPDRVLARLERYTRPCQSWKESFSPLDRDSAAAGTLR